MSVRSKNHAPITPAEREHLALVKSQPCAICGAGGPSDAHHIEQQQHFLALPLCRDCHQGSKNGIHGQRNIWRVMKQTELTALNQTIGAIYGGA